MLRPPCFGKHSTADFCSECAVWSALMSIPMLVHEVAALRRAVEILTAKIGA